MTKEEKALDYLNQFRECKFSSLQKPFTGADSGMGFILVYMCHHVKEVSQKALAEKMNVSKARITSLIQKMVQYSLKIVMRLIDEIGTDEIDRFIMTLLKIKDVLVDVTPCCNEEV